MHEAEAWQSKCRSGGVVGGIGGAKGDKVLEVGYVFYMACFCCRHG